MTVLNTTNDGLPNVFALLYEVLHREGCLSERDIRAVVTPNGLSTDNGGMVQKTLRRWTDLGVFLEAENSYSVNPVYLSSPTSIDTDAGSAIRRVARRALFAAENNLRLWEATESKAADLTRSLAWILAQDVYSLEWSALGDLEAQQIVREDARMARNDTRLNGLRLWVKFLGFLWEDIGGPTVDPTVAVRESVTDFLADDQEHPIAVFLEQLSAVLPVLDGGVYRTDVEANLDRKHWAAPQPVQISTALSRALLRLRREQVIDLISRADAGDGRSLLGPVGVTDERAVTHVRLTRGA